MNELFKKPASAPRRSSLYGSRATPPASTQAQSESRGTHASRHRQQGERTSSVLACCPLGDVVLGVDSTVVESIGELSPGEPVAEGSLDLAARYGVPWSSAERRRCLVLRRGAETRTFLVGSEIMVREFHGPLSPLPPFLSGLARSAALRGYFAWPRGYVFVLDLDSIFDRSSK